MAGFVHTAQHGQISFNLSPNPNIVLMDPRWRCMNLQAVEGTAVRGSDLITPTRTGRLPRRRYLDSLTVNLEMRVTGAASDSSGTATAGNYYTQLRANVVQLRRIITETPTSELGIPTTYTPPGASAVAAYTWVENFEVSPDTETNGRITIVTFDLVIPAGKWT